MDLSNFALSDLKLLLVKIPKEIERREKDEKVKFVKEIETLAAKRGFDLSDLISGAPIKKERAAVAVKYRHPTDADLAWSGRGRQPRWVVDFLADGGKMEDLSA